jgi:plastocyanin
MIATMRLIPLAALLALAACADAPEPRSAAPPVDDAASTVTTVTGRAPAGAIVSLEPAAGPLPLPEGPAIMDQFSKAFVPDVLFVRVGQPVIFKNSEDQLHNVTVTRSRTGTGVFNISQNQGDAYTHTFDQPGEYAVNCDVHPGMVATVVATNTPFAVYSNPRGTFDLPNVPPGQYTLRVQSSGTTNTRTIDVKGRRLDVGDATRLPS